jgi:predicted DNA binding protein
MATSSITHNFIIDESNAEAFVNALDKSIGNAPIGYMKALSHCLVQLGQKYNRMLTEQEIEIASIAFEAGYKTF